LQSEKGRFSSIFGLLTSLVKVVLKNFLVCGKKIVRSFVEFGCDIGVFVVFGNEVDNGK
jgi:hypothetical protein